MFSDSQTRHLTPHQELVAFHLDRLRRFVSLERSWDLYLKLNGSLGRLIDRAIRSTFDDCLALGAAAEAERIVARRNH